MNNGKVTIICSTYLTNQYHFDFSATRSFRTFSRVFSLSTRRAPRPGGFLATEACAQLAGVGLAGAVVRDMRRTCQLAPNMAGQATLRPVGAGTAAEGSFGWVMAPTP